MERRTFIGFGLCLAALTAAGCGYGFRGTVSYLPKELKTIAIPYLQNDTAELGLEATITDALIREFNRSKLLKLAEPRKADLILRGRITFVGQGAVAFLDNTTALQRRVEIAANMELARTDNRRLLWKQRGIREGEDYDVSDDTTITEQNREDALKQAATNFARRVHDSIFENF